MMQPQWKQYVCIESDLWHMHRLIQIYRIKTSTILITWIRFPFLEVIDLD